MEAAMSSSTEVQDQTTRTVYVVSTNYSGGEQIYVIDSPDEDLAGTGSGAFDWYAEREHAMSAYLDEIKSFVGLRARIRLLAMEVPIDLEGEDVSHYLNGDIDALEIEAPAILQTDAYLA